MKRQWWNLLTVIGALLLTGGMAFGTPEIPKLLASDGVAGDRLGAAVAISGDTAIVGAYLEDAGLGMLYAGAAYVYQLQHDGTWLETQKLVASDPGAGRRFGYSVAMDGDRAIIGAIGHQWTGGWGGGAAYIFERQGDGSWLETQKLTASDGAAGDQFGISVGISGSFLIVGAYGVDHVAFATVGPGDPGYPFPPYDPRYGQIYTGMVTYSYSGAAYAFRRQGDGSWLQGAKLRPPQGDRGEVKFGISVAVAGGRAVVGAPYASTGGFAYVFEIQPNGSWHHDVTLEGWDGMAHGARFGHAVAIDGTTAMIGAYYDNLRGPASGAVYAYELQPNGDWQGTQVLTGSDSAAWHAFGNSVAISGDIAIIGAFFDSDAGPASGSAYVFARVGVSAWLEVAKLLAFDGESGDYFGSAVAFGSEYAVVGAPYDDDKGTDAGAAYVSGPYAVDRLLDLGDYNSSVLASTDTALAIGDSKGTVGMVEGGAACVLEKNGDWELAATLLPPGGEAGEYDHFGSALDVSGDVIVVGAPDSDLTAQDGGAAFAFEKNGAWDYTFTITASDGEASDRFGSAIAVVGDIALIGAPGDDDNGADAGAAYFFERAPNGTWDEIRKVKSALAGHHFGASVDLDATYAVIGAPNDTGYTAGSGAVYVFKADGLGDWAFHQKLIVADGAAADYFGAAVGISGDLIAVGAPGDDDGAADSGSVYTFRLNVDTWELDAKLVSPEPEAGVGLGEELDLNAPYLAVGSPGRDVTVFIRDAGGAWNAGSRIEENLIPTANYGQAVAVVEECVWVGAEQSLLGVFQYVHEIEALVRTYDGDEDTLIETPLAVRNYFGEPLDYTITAPPAKGVLLGTAPDVVYLPDQGTHGADTFSYSVVDTRTGGFSSATTISVTVHDTGDPPVALDQTVAGTVDQPAAITLRGYDEDNDPLTFEVVGLPAHGDLVIAGENNELVTYYPDLGFSATDAFTFRVTDGDLTSDLATVIVDFTGAGVTNNAPIAYGKILTTDRNVAVPFTLDAFDADGHPLDYGIVTPPTKGELSQAPGTEGGPDWTYTPYQDRVGADSFTFDVTDGLLFSSPAAVSVTIRGENSAPVAQAGSVQAARDASTVIALQASDPDGDALTYTVVAPPAHGALTGSGASRTYTPDAGYGGADSFAFTVNDGTVDSAAAVVTIWVGIDDEVALFDFNDQAWETDATDLTEFGNTGYEDPDAYYLAGSATDYEGVSFQYNDYGGTCLHIDADADLGIYLSGPELGYGDKFVLEARLRLGAADDGQGNPIFGPIDLILDEVGTVITLRWGLDADGRMLLDLNEIPASFELSAVSTDPLMTADEWTFLQVAVDLGGATLGDIVTMYKDNQEVPIDDAALVVDPIALAPTGVPVKMVKRGAAIALDVDFVRAVTGVDQHTVTDFYPGEVNVAEGASASVLIPGQDVLKRVRLSMAELAALTDEEVAALRAGQGGDGEDETLYDTHPNPPCVFHGVFEVNLGLETEDFDGSLFVDVSIQKPEDQPTNTWRKIGEIVPDPKPEAGVWWLRYFWDSRTPAYDWTAADAQPYHTDDEVLLKFEIR